MPTTSDFQLRYPEEGRERTTAPLSFDAAVRAQSTLVDLAVGTGSKVRYIQAVLEEPDGTVVVIDLEPA